MYERFTDRARTVMLLANREATRLNHKCIGTEHVLLGLLAEGGGVAASVLEKFGATLSQVRREVGKRIQAGPDAVVCSRLPQTPGLKKVVECAVDEARALNHNYVGTEHLLLGLLREADGVAAEVMTGFGLNLETARAEVLSLLGQNMPQGGEPTDRARPDFFHIATKLMPESAETYGVVEPHPSLALTDDHLRLVRERIESLGARKEGCVREQDFAAATRCRDEAEALKRLLLWYEWSRRPR